MEIFFGRHALSFEDVYWKYIQIFIISKTDYLVSNMF